MISDQTCVHLDIEADFIMFKPVVSCKLNGKVNKIAKRHVGCLVHDHFNAWIPHTSSTEKVAADILMGAEVEFTVQDISTNRNVLSIKGKFEKFLSPVLQKNNIITINPLAVKPKTPRKKKNAANTTVVDANTSVEECATASEGNDSVTTKKKKKHRKEVTDTSMDVSVDSQRESESNITANSTVDEELPIKVKKKHKKDKRKSVEVNETVVCGSGNINDSIASVTSCEPLFTSTQTDEVNNNKEKTNKKHKKKKKSEKIAEMDESKVSENSFETTGARESASEELVQDSASVQATAKRRKRRHEDNKFTNLKESIHNDSDLAVPSPVKKLKKHKKLVIDFDFDSSADFEDSCKIGKKEKKKKKH
ncbi:DNA-directed RNA polymerase I subunit RPA43-like [Mercenaria mercenaria]|uniref:DNA-directed RNA polymerase I subunit RPA43-like n=1 Tax=Mercenaria mercenaria TaxID=6596 RepID=UPI00234F71B7|nr:DNA-directed RNA polymerase I subunit RPA43-like [Mercenaria mercenaria]